MRQGLVIYFTTLPYKESAEKLSAEGVERMSWLGTMRCTSSLLMRSKVFAWFVGIIYKALPRFHEALSRTA